MKRLPHLAKLKIWKKKLKINEDCSKGAAIFAAPSFFLGSPSVLSFRLFRFLHCFPFLELPLAFLGFVIGDNVGKDTPGDWFNDVLRNTGIVYGFASTAHKFWSLRVVFSFQGAVWVRAKGCWSMANLLSNFDYPNHRVVNVRSVRQSKLQTKCRHPSRVSASKLFCYVLIIPLIKDAVNRTRSVVTDREIALYRPL